MQQEQITLYVLPFMICLLFPTPLSASQIPLWRGAGAPCAAKRFHHAAMPGPQRLTCDDAILVMMRTTKVAFSRMAFALAAADSVHFLDN
jgi:hypothetical protein